MSIPEIVIDVCDQGVVLAHVTVKSTINESWNLGADLLHRTFDKLLRFASAEKRKTSKAAASRKFSAYFSADPFLAAGVGSGRVITAVTADGGSNALGIRSPSSAASAPSTSNAGLDPQLDGTGSVRSWTATFTLSKDVSLSSSSPYPDLWTLSYNATVDRIHTYELVTTGILEDILMSISRCVDLPFLAARRVLKQCRDVDSILKSSEAEMSYLLSRFYNHHVVIGADGKSSGAGVVSGEKGRKSRRRMSKYILNGDVKKNGGKKSSSSDVSEKDLSIEASVTSPSSSSAQGSYLGGYDFGSATQTFCNGINNLRQTVSKFSWKGAKALIDFDNVDSRSHEEIVTSSGYPYEAHLVHTEDGYINKLERIPRSNSLEAVYLQHGVLENSAAWVTGGTIRSLAFRLYDQGYDVYLGNLRGTDDLLHEDKDKHPKEYWDFTLNEHAFYDIPAFVSFISKLKSAEFMDKSKKMGHSSKHRSSHHNSSKKSSGGTENGKKGRSRKGGGANHPHHEEGRVKINVVAHSMGAACSIMSVIHSRMHGKSHMIDKLILLSPAGYHDKAPWLLTTLAPVVEHTWAKCVYAFRLPTETMRKLVSKLHQDIHNAPPARDVMRYVGSMIVGGEPVTDAEMAIRRTARSSTDSLYGIGDPSSAQRIPKIRKNTHVIKQNDEHALEIIHNMMWNFLNGTSVGVFKHFLQNFQSKKFQAFDYGSERNVEVYGSVKPSNFLEHFGLIDIPVHFIMGLKDTLIEPQNILKQFHTMAQVKPNLAHLKTFDCGHLDFTYGGRDEVWSYILSVLPEYAESQHYNSQ
eukprot:Nk52_evm19s2485 gene=Nk52_evmTU19s2485